MLVNGRPWNELCLRKSVRQGDPLSPLLFVSVADVFTKMNQNAARAGLLQCLGSMVKATKYSLCNMLMNFTFLRANINQLTV